MNVLEILSKGKPILCSRNNNSNKDKKNIGYKDHTV